MLLIRIAVGGVHVQSTVFLLSTPVHLWSNVLNALKQELQNNSVEFGVDDLPFWEKVLVDHAVAVEKCTQEVFILDICSWLFLRESVSIIPMLAASSPDLYW
ncbi:hypothetical protein NPIL_315761 [Nephila pilipes]|uniref:Uncharacterized protein n=1 Tax=Nephila pilipes TaxID=299642 RepID=A0A8X6N235_NEPPI|nr:hypothetical protein NPIL_315761 [Nephila pilipes]